MSELYEQSLIKLELDRVLALLADKAGCPAAAERCRALRPMTEADDVRRALAETSAACRLMQTKGVPGFRGAVDVSDALMRAERGGSLSPAELLRVAGLLRCARTVKSYGDTDHVDCVLDPLFNQLIPNRFLEEKITAAIISEDEIADAASSELASIRRKMRAQGAKIKESLQKIISSPAYAKALREPIITMRGDRYVVPVKAESKSAVPGLVHDVSSSGGTFFIEPMSAVNANNALRELALAEQAEIERILGELSADVSAHRDRIEDDYKILVELDVIFAKAQLSYAQKAIEPEIAADGALEFIRARHPLIDPQVVVPITVRLGSDFDTLVITGPNTGGKTVTLKTLGLLTLMAECGLHIPADHGSRVNIFRRVLADIGDEQSIAQSLSTFSAHMKNIVQIVDQCDSESLILFDELGAGTDPAEGAALAVALIEFCRTMGARVAATTHYAELKIFAMRTPGVVNASCEFDVESLMPTYRLLIGVPGKSNAFAISRRLGLSEDIIKKAQDMVSENDQNFEDVLNALEQQRQQMESARIEAERLRLETEQQKRKSDEYYTQIRLEKEKAAQKARAEAQYIIDDARRAADEVQQELRQLRKQMREMGAADDMNVRQSELRRKLNEAQDALSEHKPQVERPKPTRAVRVGDTVELIRLGTRATVLEINKDGSYSLQAGIMKVNAKPEEVYLLEQAPAAQQYIQKVVREFRNQAANPEVDLRGMDAQEAVGTLQSFLDHAMLANLTSVRIIHGKGTGVLRRAVQEELRRNKHVKEFRLGVFGEGEDGVTIATLK
ncbi:MAG: endonuclease MutS2 [Ruminococcaceae bacterium]|nr:endonuclease MutS2 [Oscillospiraceae bacterium]